ncbi:D-3-phosphoglycerate dehydrogenase, putative [Talaromyces stipitatus ATCC 10500]|uniref:D-3-phosphoglycerate dehydrogenase, putative n=1 Tax=Talaromyces stipitatus (strain ATCC 10500 / CBS 375.48 / QM 6759 / NRRL 1006) TaxID=441959 RepID=B8MSR9_TALSN|nr:D-3-phosphoglycerate dehydrogenase, putative [Talaromyces stipitatus ATCC 10500]EED12601.1 D-3-phosphoglycerate dehydrogenase, putative [Talaromyces stipitatus ATCC 10500]
MTKPVVYVLDPYHEHAVVLLQLTKSVDVVLWNDDHKADWRQHAQEVLVRSETQLRVSDFAQAKQLRIVVKQGVGCDNIDLNAAKAGRGRGTQYSRLKQRICGRVHSRSSPLPERKDSTLDKLLRSSDVVLLHFPLLKNIRGLIKERELNMMKQTAILINAARGGIVVENALLQALKEKKIWGAALDAMEVKSPTLDAYRNFYGLNNVIITPHIGASTVENQINSGIAAARAVGCFRREEQCSWEVGMNIIYCEQVNTLETFCMK